MVLGTPPLLDNFSTFIVLGTAIRTKEAKAEVHKVKFINNLLLRVTAATSLVLLVTMFSGALGPLLSGIVSNTPVFISIFVVFNHTLGDRQMAQNFLVGTLRGTFAYLLFFLVLALTMPLTSL